MLWSDSHWHCTVLKDASSNFSVRHVRQGQDADLPSTKTVIKRTIIQEDVGVLKLVIEAPFHPLHAQQHIIAVFIPS